MVAGQVEKWRSELGVIDALAVPRPIVRLLLALTGLGTAELCWSLLDIKILATISGAVGPYCLLASTALWSLRSKVDDVLSGQDLGADGYAQMRDKATLLRRQLMLRAAWVSLCAVACFLPVLSQQLAHAIWQASVLIAGLGIAEATYNFLVAHHWDEQLREFRDEQRLIKMRESERLAAITRIEGSQPIQSDDRIGWESVDSLTPPHKH